MPKGRGSNATAKSSTTMKPMMKSSQMKPMMKPTKDMKGMMKKKAKGY